MSDAARLFLAHRERVYRYLRRIVGSTAAAELTQDVFLRAVRSDVPASNDTAARTWLFSVARNLALNYLRDERKRAGREGSAEQTAVATQELAAALKEALDGLNPLDRDVFLMREARGLAYDEIARACELTADAVRSRLHRARQQLRAALGPRLHDRARTCGVRLYDRPSGSK
jgi:RNA polymerase sigma-70 factor (ECF subfamily)